MKIIKCSECNGTGIIKLGGHVKGIAKCPICNGTGKQVTPQQIRR